MRLFSEHRLLITVQASLILLSSGGRDVEAMRMPCPRDLAAGIGISSAVVPVPGRVVEAGSVQKAPAWTVRREDKRWSAIHTVGPLRHDLDNHGKKLYK